MSSGALVASVGMLAFLLGAFVSWLSHRRYCDCRGCVAWRAHQAELGIKLTAGMENEPISWLTRLKGGPGD